MGVYLNPSSKLFENTINSEIYVDKSGLLNFTNSRINTTAIVYVSAGQDVLARQLD